jgi:outer membrane protein TolC
MPARSPIASVFSLVVLAASGCTEFREYIHNGFKVGPNYQRPAALVADEWIDSRCNRLIQAPPNYGAWWSIFNDPALDRLIATAYAQNITLREAGFRVVESQMLRNFSAGNLFPQSQQLVADYTRIQRSTQTAFFNQVDPSSPYPTFGLTNFSDWRIGASFAWELDFWGRYRRSIEAADARLESSIENYDDAIVLLVSEVASSYVELRTLDQRLRVARDNAELQRESARIAKLRLDVSAVDSEVDAPQANSNLASTWHRFQRSRSCAGRRRIGRPCCLACRRISPGPSQFDSSSAPNRCRRHSGRASQATPRCAPR